MKRVNFLVLLSLQLLAGSVLACAKVNGPPGTVEDLKVIAPSFSVSISEGRRTVTTLGALKNSSADCLESVIIEVKYFDAKKALVDTVTQPLYSIVVPGKQEVAFRVRDDAAQSKDSYATQTVRVVSAEVRGSRNAKQPASSPFVDFLVSWGPMLLLIGVWIFFMQRMKRKDSPQGRTLAMFEQQNAILEAQNGLLARIAAAAEGKVAGPQ